MDKKEALIRRGTTDAVRETVTVGGIDIVVQALTEGQVKHCKRTSKDDDAVEHAFISAGMVDPKMTRKEVAQWLKGAPAGDAVTVMEVIARLSGLREDAGKSDIHGVRDGGD